MKMNDWLTPSEKQRIKEDTATGKPFDGDQFEADYIMCVKRRKRWFRRLFIFKVVFVILAAIFLVVVWCMQ